MSFSDKLEKFTRLHIDCEKMALRLRRLELDRSILEMEITNPDKCMYACSPKDAVDIYNSYKKHRFELQRDVEEVVEFHKRNVKHSPSILQEMLEKTNNSIDDLKKKIGLLKEKVNVLEEDLTDAYSKELLDGYVDRVKSLCFAQQDNEKAEDRCINKDNIDLDSMERLFAKYINCSAKIMKNMKSWLEIFEREDKSQIAFYRGYIGHTKEEFNRIKLELIAKHKEVASVG